MSCRKAAACSSPRSMRLSRCSQRPVSSGRVSRWSPSILMRPMPFSVARRLRPSRSMYSASTRRSMVAARVAGVPMPASFIASAASSSSTSLPAVSIARRSVPSVYGGRLGALGQRLGLGARDGLAHLQGGQRLLGLLVALPACSVRVVHALPVGGAPAGLDHHLAAAAEEVLGHPRLDHGALEARGGVEDGQEAPRDHVVDPLLVAPEARDVVVALGGDDRVVVADLRVVDDAPERQEVEAQHVARRVGVGRRGGADAARRCA